MAEAAGEAKKRVALICTVWGANFLEFFCEYCLASLLAPNNLPWASTAYDLTFMLYTQETDLARLQGDENFRRVSELVKVEFVFLETLSPAARQGHWVQWQHATQRFEEFSAFVIVIPDCVYSNSLLQKVFGCLERKNIIYYSLPQVCLELIVPRLLALRDAPSADRAHSILDLSEQQILSLFIEYINPKHAVAIYKPDYFVTHPEYVIAASKARLALIETVCHPLAVSSDVRNFSHTFNSTVEDAKIGFLEILGISGELTLKFIEQYFRWSTDRLDLSRSSNLAQWYYHFRERGADRYSETETEVVLSGSSALSQKRRRVTKPRLIYANAVALYQFALCALFGLSEIGCQREVRQFITLAMHAPGFRKAIMAQGIPLTIFLPLSSEPVEILNYLYKLGEPCALINFLLTHLLPGKLFVKQGQPFVLNTSKRGRCDRTRFQAIDRAMATHLPDAITGEIASHPYHLTSDTVAYLTTMKYGSVHKFADS
jgi:hypothetical protein